MWKEDFGDKHLQNKWGPLDMMMFGDAVVDMITYELKNTKGEIAFSGK